MKKIVIAGCGEIGSRHLQGLVHARHPLSIWLHDPAPEKVATAVERWAQVGGEGSPHKVSMGTLPQSVDLAIVATTARHRASAVSELLRAGDVHCWILEKPIAQDAEDRAQILSICGGAAWVNTPRRAMAWHQRIAKALRRDGGPRKVRVDGGGWGLACNAMHFIDLVRFWTASEPERFDTSGLNDLWHPARRAGFSEIGGTLRVEYADRTILEMTDRDDGASLTIHIISRCGEWAIREGEGVCITPDSSTIEGCVELQSALSGKIVDQMFDNREVDLPRLGPLSIAEDRLFDVLLRHRNRDGSALRSLDVT